MTVPIERTWAIKKTRDFLKSLLDSKQTPRVPQKIRSQAYRCLRHFPSDFYIQEAAQGKAGVFGIEQLEKE